MRQLVTTVILLTACAADPHADPMEGVCASPGIAKQVLGGRWSHHAIVERAAPASGVSIGDERHAEVVFALFEHDLVARIVDGEDEVLRMGIEAHCHVQRVPNPVTGESMGVSDESRGARWYDRSHVRLDVSAQDVVDPAFVPLPAGAEPIALLPDDAFDELASLPVADSGGGATWSFVAHYRTAAGIVVVRHALERTAE